MSNNRTGRLVPAVLFLFFSLAEAFSQAVPSRIIMGARAVTLVADAVYAFPSVRGKVLAVGGTDQGLGTFLQELDPAFPSKSILDRNASAEVYASYKPDLAVFKSALRKGIGKDLEALGIRVHYLDLETPEDYYRDLGGLGTLFHEEQRAAELVDFYKNVVEEVSRAVSRAVRPRVLVLQAAGDTFQVPPEGWMQTRIVRMAGGEPVWPGANPGDGWAKVGFEQIAAWNPDYILVISYRESVDEVVARMRKDSRFALLKAAKAGAVKGFPQDFFSWDQPDTRWALGLAWTARTLHPEPFTGQSMEAEARRFYRVLYQLDDSDFDHLIRPRLKGDHGIR